MNRAINAILGIGVAIVVFFFFILAFKIVFEEPRWEDCWEESPLDYKDPTNLTSEELVERDQRRQRMDVCQERNRLARQAYTQRVFYSSIIVGMLLLLAIIPLLSFANIAAGLGAAGLALFVYGLSVGWSSTSELVKLFLMFIAVILVLSLAVWLNLKKDKKKRK